MFLNFDLRTSWDVQCLICSASRNRRLALNMTQKEVAEKSGVPLSTLKRFEQHGEISLAGLLAIARATGALDEFQQLFPMPPMRTLDQLQSVNKPRKRARGARI